MSAPNIFSRAFAYSCLASVGGRALDHWPGDRGWIPAQVNFFHLVSFTTLLMNKCSFLLSFTFSTLYTRFTDLQYQASAASAGGLVIRLDFLAHRLLPVLTLFQGLFIRARQTWHMI